MNFEIGMFTKLSYIAITKSIKTDSSKVDLQTNSTVVNVLKLVLISLHVIKVGRGPTRGFPRSFVGILKCLVSAFCQGFTSLSEIERHTFVLDRCLSLFHLGAEATFWPMWLVGIYPGRASRELHIVAL